MLTSLIDACPVASGWNPGTPGGCAQYLPKFSARRAGEGLGDAAPRRVLLPGDALGVDLQRAQCHAANRPGGYWIAEANPDAADHGLTRHVRATAITWAVLASDGAADLINHTGRSWPEIARADVDQLIELLTQLDEWETTPDHDGRHLPRAKRHDDKPSSPPARSGSA